MSASNRRRRSDRHEEHESDERWLLTYSDMVTLLMALFIIMWAISSVNISKFDQLRASLRAAFSAKVLPEASSVLNGQRAAFDERARRSTPWPRASRAGRRSGCCRSRRSSTSPSSATISTT